MKKSMRVVLVVLFLALFSLSGNVQAAETDSRTFMLSNEAPGYLIDKLIAAGHGSENLYQVLQFLAAQPGSGIPADFVAAVGSSPAGSDVFTAALSNFSSPLNNPIGIGEDGNLIVAQILGRNYDGHAGFVTNTVQYPGIGPAKFTMATSPIYYIDAGTNVANGVTTYYRATGIAWSQAESTGVRTFMLSNEAPGYLIDKLIAAGHGSKNLYQVLQFLAAQPGSGIPADFVAGVGTNPPGSDVFTAALTNFTDASNNPIGIGEDGTLMISGIYGRDYDGHAGFVTNTVQYSGIGQAKVAMATSPIYYIDAGTTNWIPYKAIGIAWSGATQTGDNATLYFPHVDTSLPWQTEIAIINTSDQPVTGTLRALSDAGQLIDSKAVSLSAHGRRQIAVADEFTNHTNIGYIVFNTDSAAAQGYTKFYQAGKYRAAIPAVKEVNTSNIYISHIDSSARWWTGVSLVNTTSATKELTIAFNDGQSRNITLNANEHSAFTMRQLFNNQPQPSVKSAVIANASGVIGLELFGTNDGQQLEGIPLTDKTASALYYPHVDSNGWWTGIVAYNPSSSGCTITITPYNAQGAPLSPINRDLTAKETYVGVVSQLGLPAQTAWFRIDSTSPVTGFELFGTADGNQLAAYAGGNGTGAKAGVFAKIEKAGWTGIAFVNTEAGDASVTLTAYTDDGTPVATQVLPVGGHAKVVKLAEEIFSQSISSATYIAYSSDRNVVGFQLNGSSDGMMLDGLPALGGAN